MDLAFPLPTAAEDEAAFRDSLDSLVAQGMALLRAFPAEIARLPRWSPLEALARGFEGTARTVRRAMLLLRRTDDGRHPARSLAEARRHRALLVELATLARALGEAIAARGLVREGLPSIFSPAAIAPLFDRIGRVVRRACLLHRHLGRAPRPAPAAAPAAAAPAAAVAAALAAALAPSARPARPPATIEDEGQSPERVETLPARLLPPVQTRLRATARAAQPSPPPLLPAAAAAAAAPPPPALSPGGAAAARPRTRPPRPPPGSRWRARSAPA